ncbi:LD-carboxypeptidase [Candidatus Dependentiae bacterium]|nr:LD-carboxypeptidase [Candidatus Dependentiae bacterium]
MEYHKPPLLKNGAHIRIIAPSLSTNLLTPQIIYSAKQRYEEMGFSTSFSQNCFECDDFQSSSIKSRIKDLHDAFLDPTVDGIVAAIGGYNSNQLLSHINFDLIAKNPKPFCGYSDITVLLNAITKKCGIITYYGPTFSTLGQKELDPYDINYFLKTLSQSRPFMLHPAEFWSNDAWYINQITRNLIKNDGYWILQPGETSGIAIGGHLGTFNLLLGTEFMPSLEEKILLLEEDAEPANPREFDRRLQTLLMQHDAQKIKGILIGRFEKNYNMTKNLLTKIIATKNINPTIPIIANVDFGHTEPHCTLPIGGKIKIDSDTINCIIEIL